MTAVKLRWVLTNSDTKEVLKTGETSVIDINVAAGKRETLQYPVVSFVRVAKSLFGSLAFRGNYRVEILASEVTYADESAWKLKNHGSAGKIRRDERTP